MTATIQAPAAEPGMSAIDRCDRCSAQAYVRVVVPVTGQGSKPLDFCGHHFAANEATLIGRGAVVGIDNREQLTARETQPHA